MTSRADDGGRNSNCKHVFCVEFSSESEAVALGVPRTVKCNGAQRPFPGRISCGLCLRRHVAPTLGSVTTNCFTEDQINTVSLPTIAEPSQFIDWKSASKSTAFMKLIKHTKETHSGSPVGVCRYVCATCGTDFESARQLFDHSFRLLTAGILCRFCCYPFTVRGAACKHFRAMHPKLEMEFYSYQQFVSLSLARVSVGPDTDTGGEIVLATGGSKSVVDHSVVVAALPSAPVQSLNCSVDAAGRCTCSMCSKVCANYLAFKKHYWKIHVVSTKSLTKFKLQNKLKSVQTVAFQSPRGETKVHHDHGGRNASCSTTLGRKVLVRPERAQRIAVAGKERSFADVKPAKRAKQMSHDLFLTTVAPVAGQASGGSACVKTESDSEACDSRVYLGSTAIVTKEEVAETFCCHNQQLESEFFNPEIPADTFSNTVNFQFTVADHSLPIQGQEEVDGAVMVESNIKLEPIDVGDCDEAARNSHPGDLVGLVAGFTESEKLA